MPVLPHPLPILPFMVHGLAPALAFGLALGLAVSPALSQAPDPHSLFESRCAGCHEAHAGSFARESLLLEEEQLKTRSHGLLLEPFLKRHDGGLDAAGREALASLFRRQIESGGLYGERCRICHDSARTLAARKLILRDGKLVGRYSGRDIGDFLKGHGRLSLEEAASLTALFRDQLEEAGR